MKRTHSGYHLWSGLLSSWGTEWVSWTCMSSLWQAGRSSRSWWESWSYRRPTLHRVQAKHTVRNHAQPWENLMSLPKQQNIKTQHERMIIQFKLMRDNFFFFPSCNIKRPLTKNSNYGHVCRVHVSTGQKNDLRLNKNIIFGLRSVAGSKQIRERQFASHTFHFNLAFFFPNFSVATPSFLPSNQKEKWKLSFC